MRGAPCARGPEGGRRRLSAGQPGAPGGGAREAVCVGQAQRRGGHAAAPAGAVQPAARVSDVPRVCRQPGRACALVKKGVKGVFPTCSCAASAAALTRHPACGGRRGVESAA